MACDLPKKPLKVLYIINGLGTGGSERSLGEMLPQLVQAGVSPIIACFYPRSEGIEEQVIGQGFDVRFIHARGLLSRVRGIRKMIKTEDPHIIHTTHFEANVAARLAAAGLPVILINSLVTTSYDPVRYRDPKINAFRLGAVQAIDALTGRYLTSHFHAVSQTVKTAAVHALKIPADRITVIERGRDPVYLGKPGAERRQSTRLRMGLRSEDEVIVNVGRHEYAKGQTYLLEAMAMLVRVRPRLTLLIAGRSGNYTAHLRRLRKRLGLERQVSFLGHRDDVPDLLAAADLFVFPSLFEGLPGALIEAMALSLPIVASNIPAVREVVEPNGNALVIEPASVSELSTSIETLLEDRQTASVFAKRSQEIFQERFTLERSSTRMIGLYHNMICESPNHIT